MMRRFLYSRWGRTAAVHMRSTSTVTPAAASAGQNVTKPTPLSVLDRFFKADKQGPQLNYHLLLAISEGEEEQAATVARILASHVKRYLENQQAAAQANETTQESEERKARNEKTDDELLACSPSDLEHAVDKIAACVSTSLRMRDAPSGAASHHNNNNNNNSNNNAQKSYWKDPSSLTITILETSFETIAASDEDSGVESEADLKLLDEYLKNEGERWKQQKHAIAKVILDRVKAIGLTPSHIHHSDDFVSRDSSHAKGFEKLNPLKHCNIIVRGEVPSVESVTAGCDGHKGSSAVKELTTTRKEAEAELELLDARLLKRGAPAMTPEERSIALMELVMGKSKMQYSVGMHRALSECIDQSCANADEKGCGEDRPVLSSESVTKEIMASLNACGGETDNELRLAVETPVIPFTFMLKMCIWYQPSE